MFIDRSDAGRQLAAALAGPRERPVVLALPRGGVPVGLEVARALGAPLDILMVRKIGAPSQPEVALGAVVDGSPPLVWLNEQIVAAAGADEDYIEAEKARQLREIARRRQVYGQDRPAPDLAGREAIVVDDGAATGATMRIALRALATSAAAKVTVALPVAPPEVVAGLRAEADEVICLEQPDSFRAVGLHYGRFAQVTDEEVVAALRTAAGPG